MKKFMVIYYASPEAMEEMSSPDSDQAAESMKSWMEWKESLGDSLVDLGTPLGNGRKVNQEGSGSSERGVVGYSILQADALEDAEEMLEDHPHMRNEGCEIEVYEMLPLPGQ